MAGTFIEGACDAHYVHDMRAALLRSTRPVGTELPWRFNFKLKGKNTEFGLAQGCDCAG